MATTHLKLFYSVMATTSLLFGESVGMAGGFREDVGRLSHVGVSRVEGGDLVLSWW